MTHACSHCAACLCYRHCQPLDPDRLKPMPRGGQLPAMPVARRCGGASGRRGLCPVPTAMCMAWMHRSAAQGIPVCQPAQRAAPLGSGCGAQWRWAALPAHQGRRLAQLWHAAHSDHCLAAPMSWVWQALRCWLQPLGGCATSAKLLRKRLQLQAAAAAGCPTQTGAALFAHCPPCAKCTHISIQLLSNNN